MWKQLLGWGVAVALCVSPALAGVTVKRGPSDPIVRARRWDPVSLMPASASSSFPQNEQCYCHMYTIPVTIVDLDVLRMRVQTFDADDIVEVGVYDESGSIQYFEDTVDVTAAAIVDATNDLATPPSMPPASYWVCTARSAAGGAIFGRANVNAAFTTVIRFQQACAGGEMPATLTAPTRTFTDSADEVWFSMLDK